MPAVPEMAAAPLSPSFDESFSFSFADESSAVQTDGKKFREMEWFVNVGGHPFEPFNIDDANAFDIVSKELRDSISNTNGRVRWDWLISWMCVNPLNSGLLKER